MWVPAQALLLSPVCVCVTLCVCVCVRQVVRFYETHFCGPEATVVRRMKRRPVDRARDAFGLKHGKEKTVRCICCVVVAVQVVVQGLTTCGSVHQETLQHKPRGNRCLLPGLRTVDEETFPEVRRLSCAVLCCAVLPPCTTCPASNRHACRVQLLRSFTWLGNGKRSSHTCLCVLRRVRGDQPVCCVRLVLFGVATFR